MTGLGLGVCSPCRVPRSSASKASAPLEIAGPKRELRFGLVLYGGVSLAIYIYGVVYEFWRLVRASAGRERNEYSHLLDELGLRATVDIVSGTSAGGINGILLAKALATGASMDVARSIWVDHGDLIELLRDAGEREPRSLLRSELFDQLVLAGLEDMDRAGDGRPLADVVDLLVPATRLRPWLRPFPDESGLVLETTDFRKVFRLKYRTEGFNPADRELGYERNDFAGPRNGLLAEVARATSAFPFAFEPRLIRRLREDPRFSSEEPSATYFSDGGILNNKPFTETIETIYTRAAFWPVSRWLVSVEPDPGARGKQEAPGDVPEVIEVVGAALMGIPRSEDISSDLERLQNHRVRVQRAEGLLRRVGRLIDDTQRTGGSSGDALEVEALLGPLAVNAYREERRRAVGAELVDRLLDCAGLDDSSRPAVEFGLVSYIRDNPTALEAADIAFERRRIYHLLGAADAAPIEEAENAATATLRARLWAEFERVQQRIWETFGSDSAAATQLAGLADADLNTISATTTAALPGAVESLAAARAEIAAKVEAAAREFDRALPPELARTRLTVDTEEGEKRNTWHGLTFVATHYELWDVFAIVAEYVGGVAERDPIKHRHITPSAATYIRKATEDKLAGDALGHFGGFLKQTWRDNDILWGRLDAAEIIVRTLLREQDPFQDAESKIRRVQEPIARAECLELQERPDADYRLFLEREYRVGAEDIADVDVHDRAELAVRGTDVLRNMLRRLQKAEYRSGLKAKGLKPMFGLLGKGFGFGLFFGRWPVRALWGRDRALRRGITLALFVAFVWAVATLVLALFDIIPIEALAGTLGTLVALVIAIFVVYLVLLGLAARALAPSRRGRAP